MNQKPKKMSKLVFLPSKICIFYRYFLKIDIGLTSDDFSIN